MTAPQPPQAPVPAPGGHAPPRIERFINSLNRGQKLLVAMGSFLAAVVTVVGVCMGYPQQFIAFTRWPRHLLPSP